MYALVDAVSFYASAEKVFDPSIRNKPVVVLTNNDGCICAVCPIARRLGIPKFIPYFQVKSLLEKHGVVVRSSNYELYADLSERMMNVIGRFCDNQYIYSIDESFLYFDHYESCIKDWHEYGHKIRKAIWKETRLPVGVGFGETATLSKAANHAAKKLSSFNGVAVINSAVSRDEILKRMAVDEVWGIGRKISKRLGLEGINNAAQLAEQDPKHIRKQFSVVTERTVNELNGISCLSWDEVKSPKKEIFSTRSFGQRITTKNELRSALVTHAAIVGRKVRRQNSLIKKLMIFASNSPYDDLYYKQAMVFPFIIATENTCEMASAVNQVIDSIYKAGIKFYRCGVGAIELNSKTFIQPDLFMPDHTNSNVMKCLDNVNHRYGDSTLKLAAEGHHEKWQMRRAFLSPQYTSQWRDIPKIQC
ncbi:Y-family DNA polymerase [Colwellia sp. Bg11-28]|uniref:Y-family DNA polymerase n=1 Tax=Colwellia sp. Bg11-28 TaxID=2058305 RepID=UPI000C320380|nr:Y-family DNA polymerase [Colwellia sp. Bg11-28]PKH87657.1 DNA polymerase V subunit UmuC [Colwellia sp. Bg11-28]